MKIGLVGCGNWGKLILRDLISLGCEVQVVARSNYSINNAREMGAQVIVNEISKLQKLDAAVVATTIDNHYICIKELRQHFNNLAIFCEKPLTSSVEQAQDLLQKCPNNIFVMDKWRYHNGILALKEIHHSQRFGALRGLASKRLSRSNPHRDADAVWVLLPHDISIIHEILGFIPEPQAALSQVYAGNFESMHAQLGKSPWCTIDVSARSTHQERRIELRYDQHICVLNDGYAKEIEIYHWDPVEQKIAPEIEKVPFKDEMPLFTELQAFVRYVAGTAPAPKSSLEDSVKHVQTIADLMKLALK